jgi:adenine deaminase
MPARRGRRATSGRRSIDLLGVARIDHGVRAMEDQALVGRLAREQVPLTVCPLSNVRLRVVDDLAHHPLRRMLDKGLMVTVNSDDPAYFGGYVSENYRASAQALGLARDEIARLWPTSIASSPRAREDGRSAVS